MTRDEFRGRLVQLLDELAAGDVGQAVAGFLAYGAKNRRPQRPLRAERARGGRKGADDASV